MMLHMNILESLCQKDKVYLTNIEPSEESFEILYAVINYSGKWKNKNKSLI